MSRSIAGLLAASLTRFSPFALAAVILLVATGAVQTIVHLESVSNLWDAGCGRALAVKIRAVVLVLVAIGAAQRRRFLPELRTAAEAGRPRAGRGGSAAYARSRPLAAALVATAVLIGSRLRRPRRRRPAEREHHARRGAGRPDCRPRARREQRGPRLPARRR